MELPATAAVFLIATWEGSMHSEEYLELHYDLLSHRALLSCGRKAYVLPDIYETKEWHRSLPRNSPGKNWD